MKREGEVSQDNGKKKQKGQKLFALKRVVASSRECLERARREVAAARAAAESSFVVGLLPLLASEEKQRRTADDDKRATTTVEVLLLFPFCPGGSLADAVESKRKKGEEEEEEKESKKRREEILSVAPLLRLFADVAEGLSRLHGESMLGHFDVKPHNIFLLKIEEEAAEEEEEGEKFRALLGDWGSARRIPVPLSSQLEALAVCEEAERSTTAAFRPPELWDPLHFAAAAAASGSGAGEHSGGATAAAAAHSSSRRGRGREREVSGSSDVWSLGASLFACLGDGRSPSEVVAGVGGGGSLSLAACSGRIEWPLASLPAPPHLSAGSGNSSSSSSPSRFVPSSAVRALVERCLSLDPDERPSAAAFASGARSLAEGTEKKRTKG